MLLPHQLYTVIPRKVQEWTASDVREWFKSNSIQIKPTFQFQEENFDGNALIEASPNYLLNKCGISSKIIIKKILEWVEQEKDQYNEYVQEKMIQMEENITQKYISQINEEDDIGQKNKQNTQKNQVAVQSFQKHAEAIVPLEEAKKWNKKRRIISNDKKQEHLKLLNQIIIKSNKNKSQNQSSSNVRFVESTYEICEQKLIFQYSYENQQRKMELRGNGDIGRRKQSEILVKDLSVSRQHAQIIKIRSQFYLRDNNSRLGTFVQIGKDKRKALLQGDILNFADQYLEILTIKMNITKGMASFDIKAKLFNSQTKGTIISICKKIVVLIGKKDRDININNLQIATNHAKIVLEKDNMLYLVKEQGQAFIKLKKQQLYRLQIEQQSILLGQQIIKVNLIHERKPIRNISQFQIQKRDLLSEQPRC